MPFNCKPIGFSFEKGFSSHYPDAAFCLYRLKPVATKYSMGQQVRNKSIRIACLLSHNHCLPEEPKSNPNPGICGSIVKMVMVAAMIRTGRSFGLTFEPTLPCRAPHTAGRATSVHRTMYGKMTRKKAMPVTGA